jgi:hypothetical protein
VVTLFTDIPDVAVKKQVSLQLYRRLHSTHSQQCVSKGANYESVAHSHEDKRYHLTELSNRSIQIMFLGSRERLVRRSDKLTAICDPTV